VFCCVCLCLFPVSQHALAVVVEVYEGETSVQLPCQDTDVTLKNRTVLWTRNDLDPKSVHLSREETDDHYSGRTSMRPDALDSSDFSLTLRKPTKTDSGTYTCSISDGREEWRLTDIQLQVKGQQQTQNLLEIQVKSTLGKIKWKSSIFPSKC
uniref:Ig-like domain-containing protein n=1 Tax=Oreochromis niloticus TaxID=8128 RepID=A0A669DC64_ORENI